MFNIGDRLLCRDMRHYLYNQEVTVIECYHGTVIEDYFVDVQTDGGEIIRGLIRTRFIKVDQDDLTPIVRKIRSMYARQYRKTGQSCFV